MERPSFSVEKAIECFIFECSCSNMIVAYTDKKKEAGRKNTQCQSLWRTTHKIYTSTVCTQTHTRAVIYSLSDTHSRPTTHSLTHTEETHQKKAPHKKWFTLKALTWPITSVMFKNRIHACGHSSDSLSVEAKYTACYTPILHLLYCLTPWKGITTFSAFECFQTALRHVVVISSRKVE